MGEAMARLKFKIQLGVERWILALETVDGYETIGCHLLVTYIRHAV